ncbi:hypothetical protein EII12_02350 [Buchananella hordeovulneris]|uniref:hypothetical protein n=1 Tax=Buchananella hordeovulneris TaxID=52770 RepID=UPI000F5D50F2|nr:hypothetical protein [Buchananella hordeovulneris]RRD53323.1 hypothetical protein EII12_02350 [Buchananella hordeovulneris]
MRNLYTEIELVVDALRAAGQGEVAKRVVDLVEAGATGGEILMGVRHVLSKFLHAGEAPELQAQVREVLERINQALEPHPAKVQGRALMPGLHARPRSRPGGACP